MPFDTAQFFEVFAKYNDAVYPVQFLFYLTGIVCVMLAFKPVAASGKIISSILAILWLWMGVVYNLIFFAPINTAAYAFGGMFIVQAGLFIVSGVIRNELAFRLRYNLTVLTGIVLILYSLIVYPLLGSYFGHTYPHSPTFGLPCPTTIFTLGILLLAEKKFPRLLLLIPVIWSIVGFTAAILLGVFEDTGLPVASVLTVALLALKKHS